MLYLPKALPWEKQGNFGKWWKSLFTSGMEQEKLRPCGSPIPETHVALCFLWTRFVLKGWKKPKLNFKREVEYLKIKELLYLSSLLTRSEEPRDWEINSELIYSLAFAASLCDHMRWVQGKSSKDYMIQSFQEKCCNRKREGECQYFIHMWSGFSLVWFSQMQEYLQSGLLVCPPGYNESFVLLTTRCPALLPCGRWTNAVLFKVVSFPYPTKLLILCFGKPSKDSTLTRKQLWKFNQKLVK